MSAVPNAVRRHPLGLPAGSIRALLAFEILGLLWGLAVMSDPFKDLPLGFVYLQIPMVLALASFFAAHGKSIGKHVSTGAPLGLPGGSVRFLLFAVYAGLQAYVYYKDLRFQQPPPGKLGLVILIVVGGFFLGHLLGRLIGDAPAGHFQDFVAWFSLLAGVGLVVLGLVHLVINVSLPEEMRLDVETLEVILSAVVSFYFGARS